MFDIVDTAFREFIVCSFLQDLSKGKGSSLQLICNAHIAFLLLWGSTACAVTPATVAAEYPYSTLNSTATYSSLSGTA